MTPTLHEPFPHSWSAQVLAGPPMIAPARQFVYPQAVAGEEDALARGALLFTLKPAEGGMFLATCALGFKAAELPSGVYSCPNPGHVLAVAGGYAYLIDAEAPEGCEHLPLRPVVAVLPVVEEGLILLAGFHQVCAVDAAGLRWTTVRLSWEGLTLGEVRDGTLQGMGWNMPSDREVGFAVDLKTGEHTGGGF
jgi:hypothetical protein